MVALIGATAWACTPQASIKTDVASGAPGTAVKLTGSTFDASGQPVRVWWGGAGKQLLTTATVTSGRSFTATFSVPNVEGGVYIVSATQVDASGVPIAGSPVNTTFRVDGPSNRPVVNDFQATPDNSVTEPAPVAVPAAEPAPAPVAATPAPRPAPRVRVAPAGPAATPAAAPAAAAPAPAPAPVAEPAPAPAPAAPAPVAPAADPTPAPRPVMVSMAADSDGSSTLAIVLVGVGLVLALGATALVLAGRRDSKAPARARR